MKVPASVPHQPSLVTTASPLVIIAGISVSVVLHGALVHLPILLKALWRYFGWLVGIEDPIVSCLSMSISLGIAFLHLVLMVSLILTNGIVAILILARAGTCLCILSVFTPFSGSQEHVWVYLPEAERLLGTEPYCPNQSLPGLGTSMSIRFRGERFVSEQ